MSFATVTEGEMEFARTFATALIEYFYAHLEKCSRSPLSMHPALFEFVDKTEFVAWLRDGGVGRQIYTDIETKAKLFKVGSLGSIWFDKEYEDEAKTKKRVVRVGLLPTFAASDFVLPLPTEYTEEISFSFNIDLLSE